MRVDAKLMSRPVLAVGLVTALAAASLIGYLAAPRRPNPHVAAVRPAPPPGGYAGSASCAECHAEIARAYQTHPMAHSLAAAQDADRADPSDTKDRTFVADGAQYFVEVSGTRVVHHQRRIAADGHVIVDTAAPVAYAIGSGIRGRSYLIDRDGMPGMHTGISVAPNLYNVALDW